MAGDGWESRTDLSWRLFYVSKVLTSGEDKLNNGTWVRGLGWTFDFKVQRFYCTAMLKTTNEVALKIFLKMGKLVALGCIKIRETIVPKGDSTCILPGLTSKRLPRKRVTMWRGWLVK